MAFFNTWLQGIIISVVIATIIEMILPNGNNKKYIKMILGIFIIYNIISPIISKFTKQDFNYANIIDIDKYVEETKKYKIDVNTINKEYDNSIEEIYLLNLKKDIKSRIEEKDYRVNTIKIELENTTDYKIKKINLVITKKDLSQTNENSIQNNNMVNKIEDITINIKSENDKNKIDNKKILDGKYNENNQLSEKEIFEIISILNLNYNIPKENIYIN